MALLRGLIALSACVLVVVLMPTRSASSAAIELKTEFPQGASSIQPLELARRLREATLDRKTLGRLAAERATGANDAERFEASGLVESGVEVVTVDGRTFYLVVTDRDEGRAMRMGNELAAIAVARAPDVVAKACPAPGCSGTARLAAPAVPLDLPLEPERMLAFCFGVLFALAVAVVPLTIARPKSVVEGLAEKIDDAPTTERLQAAVRAPDRTLPVGSAARVAAAVRQDKTVDRASDQPPAERRPTGDEGRPRFDAPPARSDAPPVRSDAPPVRSDAPPARSDAPPVRSDAPPASSDAPAARSDAPPSAERPDTSPIMGYPATPGWRPNSGLNASSRASLAQELRSMGGEQCLVLAVSASPLRSGLKSQAATEVALALSSAGDLRVLLVEADFRNPGIAGLLHLTVSDAADFTRELGRRASGSPSTALHVIICTETLHVLPALQSPSADLILTTDFEGCVTMLRDYYDVVIVNAPLTSAGVYCTAIADVVDGVIVVGEVGANIPEPFKRRSLLKILPS
jgi:Mrp family chromosome partitioning ATPase